MSIIWTSIRADGFRHIGLSLCGKVKNLKTGKIRSPLFKNGRRSLRLMNENTGKFRMSLYSRWICYAYYYEDILRMGNIPWHADHIDNNCLNDSVHNIRVISASENVQKGNMNRRCRGGMEVYVQGMNGDFTYFSSLRKVSEAYDMDRSIIRTYLNTGMMYNGYMFSCPSLEDLEGEVWFECKLNQFQGLKWSNKGRIHSKYGKKWRGNICNNYYRVTFQNKSYYVHRIIMMEIIGGEIPLHLQVDHLNMNSRDNRIENLRLVTPQVNNLNRRKRKRSNE